MKLPVIWVSLAFLYLADVHAADHKHQNSQNRFGSHGMALLKDGANLYVSHMPLYRRPHDYQIVYKVEVETQTHTLIQAKEQGLLSILPDNFDLDRLINGDSFEINADVYLGHFERGGQLWLNDISVKFTRRIYIRGLQGEQLKGFGHERTYEQLELDGNSLLLVRHITKAPSVDHLAIVTPKSLSANNRCGFASKKLRALVSGLELEYNISAEIAKNSIQQRLSECFEVRSHYWETADFAK